MGRNCQQSGWGGRGTGAERARARTGERADCMQPSYGAGAAARPSHCRCPLLLQPPRPRLQTRTRTRTSQSSGTRGDEDEGKGGGTGCQHGPCTATRKQPRCVSCSGQGWGNRCGIYGAPAGVDNSHCALLCSRAAGGGNQRAARAVDASGQRRCLLWHRRPRSASVRSPGRQASHLSLPASTHRGQWAPSFTCTRCCPCFIRNGGRKRLAQRYAGSSAGQRGGGSGDCHHPRGANKSAACGARTTGRGLCLRLGRCTCLPLGPQGKHPHSASNHGRRLCARQPLPSWRSGAGRWVCWQRVWRRRYANSRG